LVIKKGVSIKLKHLFFIKSLSCPEIAIHKKYHYGKRSRIVLYKAHPERLQYVF
jgi:hypothetical protein